MPQFHSAEVIKGYVDMFNAQDKERYGNLIPNSEALGFLQENIPFFECPDKELEKTYYFRWWTFRKHIRMTEEGYVITEFLPDVPWSKKYNTISCPASHHIREGRWLKDKSIIADYLRFWMLGSGSPRQYSFPVADSALEYYKVTLNRQILDTLYRPLTENLIAWEKSNRDSTGLFWQMDGYDGMEVSVSGQLSQDNTGYRPTINAYAYADARALAEIAGMLNLTSEEKAWKQQAQDIRERTDRFLWDEEDQFYKVVPRHDGLRKSPTRELLGYVPWMYGMAGRSKGEAWKQMLETGGFKAPYGPTVTEQRDPGFTLSYEGHECQWNGPSWPFATSQTLTAMAECLHEYGEMFFSKSDYLEALSTFSLSHRITADDGTRDRCWIDENLHPYTGDWIARTILIRNGERIPDRGKDYNHSTFCDLVISGLMGIRPQADGTIEISPLVPENRWDWFAIGNIQCHGRELTVVYDRDGTHYGGRKGFSVYLDGQCAAHERSLTRVVLD